MPCFTANTGSESCHSDHLGSEKQFSEPFSLPTAKQFLRGGRNGRPFCLVYLLFSIPGLNFLKPISIFFCVPCGVRVLRRANGEHEATTERPLADACYTVGNGNARKAFATIERPLADAFYALGKRDRLDVAFRKGTDMYRMLQGIHIGIVRGSLFIPLYDSYTVGDDHVFSWPRYLTKAPSFISKS